MKRILALLLSLVIVLSLCACSEESTLAKELNNHEGVIAIQNEYGIDFKFVPAKEKYGDYYFVIESDGYSELSNSEKLEIFYRILELKTADGNGHYISFCYDDSGCLIISHDDNYTAETGNFTEKEGSLFKNGTEIYTGTNLGYDDALAEEVRKENEAYAEYKEENPTEYSESYDYNDSNDDNNVDKKQCKSCNKEFPAGDSGKNYMNIAKTGMCNSCYNSYKSMEEYVD